MSEPQKRRSRRKSRAATTPVGDSAKPSSGAQPEPRPTAPWYRSTFALAMASALLLFFSFPLPFAPLSWVARVFSATVPTAITSIHFSLWPLAWIAPVFWLWLIREPQLTGRRPYRALWPAGFAYNLLVFHFLLLPHWAGVFGWLALSAYLGVYLPLFIGVTRTAVHRLRVPLLLAAPTVWVSLELIRGYAFTGISAAMLGHTQVGWTSLIQMADAFGAYGVSFLMMFTAAAVVETMPSVTREWRWWPAPVAACLVIAALAYGNYRLQQTPPDADKPVVEVALVQGTVETVFDSSREALEQRIDNGLKQHCRLTSEALYANKGVQLVIWPESMLAVFDVKDERTLEIEPDVSDEYLTPGIVVRRALGSENVYDETSPVRLLAGTHTARITKDAHHIHNAAVLFEHDGRIASRYFKSHLVLFGEYIPLGSYLPWLYQFLPIGGGLTPGEQPLAFETGGLRFAPSICFESLVPHYIQRQVGALKAEGETPDVLVNVTNDGWFHGSAGLDQHLASNVFRAVEQRRPMLVAANEGVSAHIDGVGRVVATLPRQQEGVIIAEVRADGRDGWYQHLGDLPAWGLVMLTGLTALAGVWLRRRDKQHPAS